MYIGDITAFDKDIYIYGAGKRGKKLYTYLTDRGISVKGFIDNDFEKKGLINCIPCIPFIELDEDKNRVIIISQKDNSEVIRQVESAGLLWITYDDIMHHEYFFPKKKYETDFCNARPFNWYDSPYADVRFIHENEEDIFSKKEVLGIDFNSARQFELLNAFIQIDLHKWTEHKSDNNRYYYDNSYFGRGSANILYYMMRFIQPKRIIEVGSGFSTAVMLDTNEYYFNNSIEINCIEPNPDRLRSILRTDDHINLEVSDLQSISLDYFDQLMPGDILFIDSSHVGKINSDVNYYLFEIFPRIKRGVYIHVHDIAYPMEYPPQWIYEGRVYNEMYMLRAFLMYNNTFSIQFFGDMLANEYNERLPGDFKEIGGSIWLLKE